MGIRYIYPSIIRPYFLKDVCHQSKCKSWIYFSSSLSNLSDCNSLCTKQTIFIVSQKYSGSNWKSLDTVWNLYNHIKNPTVGYLDRSWALVVIPHIFARICLDFLGQEIIVCNSYVDFSPHWKNPLWFFPKYRRPSCNLLS